MGQRAERVKQFLHEDEGLTSIEYALILMMLIVLCLTAVRYLGRGTNTTAHNVNDRTTNSAGPPLPIDAARPPQPIEVIRSSPPNSFDGVLFVSLACMVTACLFTAACIVCYRISEWRAQQATLRKLRERTDEEKIDAHLGHHGSPGRVLNTKVDGPIQDRLLVPISPPPVVASPLWWLSPNANLEGRASADLASTEGPSLPPHPDTVAAPAPGKVIVYDAASLAGVVRRGPVIVEPGPIAAPKPPAGS